MTPREPAAPLMMSTRGSQRDRRNDAGYRGRTRPVRAHAGGPDEADTTGEQASQAADQHHREVDDIAADADPDGPRARPVGVAARGSVRLDRYGGAMPTPLDAESIRTAPKVLLHDHLDGGLRPAIRPRNRRADRARAAGGHRRRPRVLVPRGVVVGLARALPRDVRAHRRRDADGRGVAAGGPRGRPRPRRRRRRSTPRSGGHRSSTPRRA